MTAFQKFQQDLWELLKSKLLIKETPYLIGRGCHSNLTLLSHWLGAAHQEVQSQGKHREGASGAAASAVSQLFSTNEI